MTPSLASKLPPIAVRAQIQCCPHHHRGHRWASENPLRVRGAQGPYRGKRHNDEKDQKHPFAPTAERTVSTGTKRGEANESRELNQRKTDLEVAQNHFFAGLHSRRIPLVPWERTIANPVPDHRHIVQNVGWASFFPTKQVIPSPVVRIAAELLTEIPTRDSRIFARSGLWHGHCITSLRQGLSARKRALWSLLHGTSLTPELLLLGRLITPSITGLL